MLTNITPTDKVSRQSDNTLPEQEVTDVDDLANVTRRLAVENKGLEGRNTLKLGVQLSVSVWDCFCWLLSFIRGFEQCTS